MKTISYENIILFHNKIANKTGGATGVLNKNCLESCLIGCFNTFDGNELYPTDIGKISFITYNLIKNHCFIDGNKRIGIAVMCYLLKLNNIIIKYSQNELISVGINVAQSLMDKDDIENWIINHIIN